VNAVANMRTLKRLCRELDLTIEGQDTRSYGRLYVHAPHLHRIAGNGLHCLVVGWGDGEVSCTRAEAIDDACERLAGGIELCNCADCMADLARAVVLDPDTPDGVILDRAKELGLVE
jgi:hypothetical protein